MITCALSNSFIELENAYLSLALTGIVILYFKFENNAFLSTPKRIFTQNRDENVQFSS